MKKLFTSLFVAALVLGLTARAAISPAYDLDEKYKQGYDKNGNPVEVIIREDFPVLTETDAKLKIGSKTYRVYDESSMVLEYQVTDPQNRELPGWNGKAYQSDENKAEVGSIPKGATYHNLAHVTFTANKDNYLSMWTDIDSHATSGEAYTQLTLNVSDYGIYFVDDEGYRTSDYLSMKDQGQYITEGQKFGVYYTAETTGIQTMDANHKPIKDENGDTIAAYDKPSQTYTTTENWVGSFDSPKDLEKGGSHSIKSSGEGIITSSPFFCLYQGTYDDFNNKLEWEHFEFGFVVGHPLPGTFASILIGSLCAGGVIRKRNKKH